MTRDELLFVYQEELPRLRSLAKKHMGYYSSDIEDVLQDVFLQAWLHCDSLREDHRCAGWLMRITTNTCVTYLRRIGSCTLYDELPTDNMEDAYARMMTRLMMEDAMAHLSPAARKMVRLHDFEGYPVREVAQRMRKPEGTVKSVLYRARARMRDSQSEFCQVISVG